MNTPSADPQDIGLARQRTWLGWQRTALSLIAANLAVWRLNYQSHDAVSLAPRLLSMLMAFGVVLFERRREPGLRDGLIPTLIALSTAFLALSGALSARA